MKLDYIILAKRDTRICAIKYTNLEKTIPTSQSTNSFWQVKANWQRYDLIEGKYKLTDEGADRLSRGPMAGTTFHLSYPQDHSYVIYCGKNFKIRAEVSGEVKFNMNNRKNDSYNVELFPTNFKEFSGIDVNSPNIKWVKFKEHVK